ncbi:hypothetical protein IWW50_002011 [Coemansia erecta]|nr:hypothetical protein GGF43_001544 [Coemansia sp. RSA 2618]KAJ2827181.1 hypothetical protein IWW50_002011 [Coemansia erecta]
MDVVIVTGASKGIGRQVCIELLKRQPLIVIAVARSADALQTLQHDAHVVTDHAGHSGRLIPISGDITDPPTRDKIIDTARATNGRLRALINNAAALTATGPILAASPAELHQIFDTNLLAPIALASQCLPMLQSHQSSRVILNITSSTSQGPVPGFAAYGATKVSLNYLTQALAAEHPDITSIAFYPGVVDTQMNKCAYDVAQKYRKHAERLDNRMVDMSATIAKLEEPISPDRPCAIIANLALHARHELSGKYVVFSDKEMDGYAF